MGREFTLVTDHRPLLKILGPYEGVPTLAAARLQRWAPLLSAYNYNLKFKSGVDNKKADLLSRLPIPMQVIDPNEEIYHVDFCDQVPVTVTEIARETQRDPILRKAYEYIRSGWRTSGDQCLEPYARRSTELSIDNGCLLWGSRVIIPRALRTVVAEEIHNGHLGVVRIKALARSFIWWPNLDRDLEDLAKRCERCQSQKGRPARVLPSHPWIYPAMPWESVHADFAELSGRQYLLMIDAFSKWPEVHELGTHATTEQTINAMRRSFSYHGLPRRLVTDNGPQFRSHEFQMFVKANGIWHQLTPPYYPSCNGQAERLVQELKKGLKSRPTGRCISHQVSSFLLRYRATPNTTTGKAPRS